MKKIILMAVAVLSFAAIAVAANPVNKATGAIENYRNTAPNFADLPKSNGSTIVIPNAWSAEYIDSLRNVVISGTLTVNA